MEPGSRELRAMILYDYKKKLKQADEHIERHNHFFITLSKSFAHKNPNMYEDVMNQIKDRTVQALEDIKTHTTRMFEEQTQATQARIKTIVDNAKAEMSRIPADFDLKLEETKKIHKEAIKNIRAFEKEAITVLKDLWQSTRSKLQDMCKGTADMGAGSFVTTMTKDIISNTNALLEKLIAMIKSSAASAVKALDEFVKEIKGGATSSKNAA